MKTSYPRLRRAKIKGGPDLRIIHGHTPEMASSMVKTAEQAAELVPDLAGYALVAWDFRGRAVRSWHIHDLSPIQRSLLPSYVRDILLKEITETQTLESLEYDE